MSNLQSLKTPAYSNWLMLNTDGSQMCRCAMKRAKWYLDRDLADIVSEDPPTIKLKFKPNGPGNQNDDYSLAPKQNICVRCGTDDDLTKHHIVPIMYRQFFPLEIKGRSSHDIVVICVDCHIQYEDEALKLKQQISVEMTGHHMKTVRVDSSARDIERVSRLSSSLKYHGDKIPADRRQQMLDTITKFLGKVPDDEDLDILREASTYCIKSHDPGKAIVEKILEANKLEEFVIRWRQHFIDVAEPKYMPAHWGIYRKLTRE